MKKIVKEFFLAIKETFTSILKLNMKDNEMAILDFESLNSKSIEQIEAESHEILKTIMDDYQMTMIVKRLFIGLTSILIILGLYLLSIHNWGGIIALLSSVLCYKLYENRKEIGDAKYSFIQFTISNEVECEKVKKNPGYQMRNPGIYEDNLN